jgi:hypothetical protein
MNKPAFLLLVLAFPAAAQVSVQDPWARATPPGASTAGGYMLIVNRGTTPDRLVGATSPAAARVETHVSAMEGDVMKMRQVPGYDIPAGGRFELRPGGAHLMFIDIKRPFKEGEKIPVTLRFQRAGEIRAEFVVARMGASGHGMNMKH